MWVPGAGCRVPSAGNTLNFDRSLTELPDCKGEIAPFGFTDSDKSPLRSFKRTFDSMSEIQCKLSGIGVFETSSYLTQIHKHKIEIFPRVEKAKKILRFFFF